MTDRAQSNVLGYVLLFGVVFASITAAATLGVGSLQSARDSTVIANAEQSMEGLSNAIEDIRSDNVSARTSVFRMGSGSLQPGEPTEIRVSVDGRDVIHDGGGPVQFQPIVYQFDDTRITYESGALIQQQDAGRRIIDDPKFLLDNGANGAIVIPVVLTESPDGRSIAGSTVATYLEKTDSAFDRSEATSNVEVEITPADSDRVPIWEDLVLDQVAEPGDASCSGTSTLTCTIDVESDTSVIVRAVTVNYEFAT